MLLEQPPVLRERRERVIVTSHSDQTKEKEFHCERKEKRDYLSRDLMSLEIRCCIHFCL